MDDQRKDHIDPEGLSQGNRPKQIQTHNMPTDDGDNINCTNEVTDLLLTNKPWIEEQKGCCKGSRGT